VGELRLIAGPAGSGKTHQVLSEIAALAAADGKLRDPREVLGRPPLIVIVPEQQTLSIERQLLGRISALTGGSAAASRARVLSFTRLGNLLRASSGDDRPRLRETGHRLLVWQVCPPGPRREAQAAALADMIAEANLYGTAARDSDEHAPEHASLEQRARAIASLAIAEHDAATRQLLHATGDKLWLLAEVLSKYRARCAALGYSYRPAAAYIESALRGREVQDRAPAQLDLRRAQVWVDSFMGFTPAEEDALQALLSTCAGLTATVPVSPSGFGTGSDAEWVLEDWYGAGRELLDVWMRIARRAGVPFARQRQITFLASGGAAAAPSLPRWRAGSRLAGLALHGLQGPRTENASEAANLVGREAAGPEARAAVCADRRAEVELACRKVLRLVRDEGYRYKEISIVVRDLEPYADLLGSRLTDAGVPHYVDRRIQLSGHAAVLLLAHGVRLALEYARLALNASRPPLAYPEDVYALLKTDLLFPLHVESADGVNNQVRLAHGRDVLDRLQAHARRHNLPVHAWLADEPWGERGAWFGERSALAQTGIAALHHERLAAAAPIRELADRMVEYGGRLGLPRMLEHAWQCLFTERVQQTLQAWTDAADGSPVGGHPAALRAESIAASHRGVLQAVAGLFDELALVGQDITLAWEADEQSSNLMTFSEFMRWLNFGLSELTLGYPPAVDDCVLLTGVERGRHPPVRATLILGLSEDEWPAMSPQTAFLSDAERALANSANGPDESAAVSGESAGSRRLLVAPGSEARALREPYLALVAATRPAESLFFTHPLADRDGRELKPSRYFRGLCKALAIEPEPPPDRPATTAALAADPLSAAAPGDLAVAAALSPQREELSRIAGELCPDALTAALSWALANRQSHEQRNAVSRCADMQLDSGMWQALLFPDTERAGLTGVPLSASQLETYAACPFQHFSKYLLRLKTEEDFALGPLKVGELLHRTLQAGVSALLQAAASSGGAAFWRTLSEEEFVAALEPALAELARRLGALTGRDRVAHVLARARLMMRFFARHLLGVFAAGEGRHPRNVELAFGRLAKLPPLLMQVSGRTMLLEGKVDRLDVDSRGLGTVVDYKLGQPRLEWWALKEGLSLQLPLYLLAVQSLATHGHLGEIEPRIVEVERIEPKPKPGRGTLEFSVHREPKLPKGMRKTVDEADIPKLRDHWLDETRRAAQRVAEAMLSLRIAPHPLRSPNLGWVACQGCANRSVCRFDHTAGDRFRQARDVDSRAEAELALGGEDGAC